MIRTTFVTTCLAAFLAAQAIGPTAASGQAKPTRDEKVRSDKNDVLDDGYWIYNDLPKALDTAKRSDKPLMVVFRCIP